MSERGIWARVFQVNGYSMEDLIKMDPITFQRNVNHFLDSNITPDDEAPPEFLQILSKNKSSKSGSLKLSFNFSSQGEYEQSTSSLIQQDQNEQYEVMLLKMQQLEKDSQRRKIEEEQKIREKIYLQRSELDSAKKKIYENANQIPKEPKVTDNTPNKDILSISVILPGGRRVYRHFSASEPAKNVYSWVSCFSELFDPIDESLSFIDFFDDEQNNETSKTNITNKEADSKEREEFIVDFEKNMEKFGMPRDFQLVLPPQIIIDESKTLSELKLGKRALFNVVLDD